MTRFRYLIIVSLALVVSGCFAGRNVKPLTDMGAIEKPIAILPVGPENVVMAVESEDDYAKIAEETSAILDILARGKQSNLIGPKKVRRSLEGMAKAEWLNIWLDELKQYPKSETSQELMEIGNKLKVKQIIRVKVDVLLSGNETARWAKGSGEVGVFGIGKHWSGWVDVKADLFNLSQPRHVNYYTGSAEYSGKMGLGAVTAGDSEMACCIPFPYAVGTTKSRALGQATREAISGVLIQSTGRKPFIAEDHPRLSDLDLVHVESEPASLYSEPSLDSTVVDQVWSAMALKVIKEKDNWLQVEAPSGKKGWIAKNWLEKDIKTENEKQKLAYIPKTVKSARVSLRAEPQEKLTIDYIKYVVKRYSFYENNWNISGSFDNDFVDNGDGTITDRTTGLMWQKDGSSSSRKRKRALSYVKKLNKDQFARYSDWRLPTVEELASLLERHKTNGMHIDPSFDSKQKSCWSSDKAEDFLGHSRNAPQIWIVNFATGRITTAILMSEVFYSAPHSSELNYVRAVRGIQ